MSKHSIAQQNYVTYTGLTQSINTDSGVEVTASVNAYCYGNSPQSVLIDPLYCAWDAGLKSISFSTGSGYLWPGESSIITFKFKKTVISDSSFTYKFLTSNATTCGSDSNLIKITVNYNFLEPPSCSLPSPTNVNVTNIQTNSFSINWGNVVGATSYKIYYRPNGSSSSPSFITAGCCSTVIPSLQSGTRYNFDIYPVCSNGIEGNLSSGSATTACQSFLPPPTNLTATPYSNGYIINCTPAGYYQMDYVDLVTNQTGTAWMTTGSTTNNGSNFFYYVSPPKSFKFRLKKFEGCNQSTDWITITPPQCPVNNYPSSLTFSTQSVCGGTPGHCCGYGQFSWSAVSGAIKYEIEYMGVNLTNAAVLPVSSTFQSTSTNTTWATLYACNTNQAGTWILKYRVRSQCSNGTWSDFSPWSANFAW